MSTTEVHLLEGAELEQLLRRVTPIYSSLTCTCIRLERPQWLFEILLQAYAGLDADTLVARLESLAADHGQALRRIIEVHSQGSDEYVEARDFIYQGPEVLLVADLARGFPSRLRAVAGPSDFSLVLESMADALSGK